MNDTIVLQGLTNLIKENRELRATNKTLEQLVDKLNSERKYHKAIPCTWGANVECGTAKTESSSWATKAMFYRLSMSYNLVKECNDSLATENRSLKKQVKMYEDLLRDNNLVAK